MVPLTGAAVVAFLLFKTHRPHTLPIDNTKKPSVLIDLDGMISMHMGMPPGGGLPYETDGDARRLA